MDYFNISSNEINPKVTASPAIKKRNQDNKTDNVGISKALSSIQYSKAGSKNKNQDQSDLMQYGSIDQSDGDLFKTLEAKVNDEESFILRRGSLLVSDINSDGDRVNLGGLGDSYLGFQGSQESNESSKGAKYEDYFSDQPSETSEDSNNSIKRVHKDGDENYDEYDDEFEDNEDENDLIKKRLQHTNIRKEDDDPNKNIIDSIWARWSVSEPLPNNGIVPIKEIVQVNDTIIESNQENNDNTCDPPSYENTSDFNVGDGILTAIGSAAMVTSIPPAPLSIMSDIAQSTVVTSVRPSIGDYDSITPNIRSLNIGPISKGDFSPKESRISGPANRYSNSNDYDSDNDPTVSVSLIKNDNNNSSSNEKESDHEKSSESNENLIDFNDLNNDDHSNYFSDTNIFNDIDIDTNNNDIIDKQSVPINIISQNNNIYKSEIIDSHTSTESKYFKYDNTNKSENNIRSDSLNMNYIDINSIVNPIKKKLSPKVSAKIHEHRDKNNNSSNSISARRPFTVAVSKSKLIPDNSRLRVNKEIIQPNHSNISPSFIPRSSRNTIQDPSKERSKSIGSIRSFPKEIQSKRNLLDNDIDKQESLINEKWENEALETMKHLIDKNNKLIEKEKQLNDRESKLSFRESFLHKVDELTSASNNNLKQTSQHYINEEKEQLQHQINQLNEINNDLKDKLYQCTSNLNNNNNNNNKSNYIPLTKTREITATIVLPTINEKQYSQYTQQQQTQQLLINKEVDIIIKRKELDELINNCNMQEKLIIGYQKENENLSYQIKELKNEIKLLNIEFYSKQESYNMEINKLMNKSVTSANIMKPIDRQADINIYYLQDKVIELQAVMKQQENELNLKVKQTNEYNNKLTDNYKIQINQLESDKQKLIDFNNQLNKKVNWYIENQILIDSITNECNQYKQYNQQLLQQLNQVKDNNKKPSTHKLVNKDDSIHSIQSVNHEVIKYKRNPADIKKIKELEETIYELQESLFKRFPDSLSNMIRAATVNNSPNNHLLKEKELLKQIEDLTNELNQTKDEYQKKLRSLRQEHERIQINYNNLINEIQKNKLDNKMDIKSESIKTKKITNITQAQSKIRELEIEIERIRKFYTKKIEDISSKHENQIIAIKKNYSNSLYNDDKTVAINTANIPPVINTFLNSNNNNHDNNIVGVENMKVANASYNNPDFAISINNQSASNNKNTIETTNTNSHIDQTDRETYINKINNLEMELKQLKELVNYYKLQIESNKNLFNDNNYNNQQILTLQNTLEHEKSMNQSLQLQLKDIIYKYEILQQSHNNIQQQLINKTESWYNEKQTFWKQYNDEVNKSAKYLIDIKDLQNQLINQPKTPQMNQLLLMENQISQLEARLMNREKEIKLAMNDTRNAAKIELSRLQAIHEQELREKDEQLTKFQNQIQELILSIKKLKIQQQ